MGPATLLVADGTVGSRMAKEGTSLLSVILGREKRRRAYGTHRDVTGVLS